MLNFGEYITIADAVLITVVSITIVFLILTLIAVIIAGIGHLLKGDEKKVEAPKITKNKPIVETNTSSIDLSEIEKDENKLVAMFIATIDANDNDENATYKVTSIKEI